MHLEHPYHDLTGGAWLRGNLHAHTTRSDGRFSTQEVLNKYRNLHYDFLMLSDHDIFTSEADHAQYDPGDMILIPGNEITADGPHLLHVDARSFVAPMEDRQEVIEAINRQNGFAIINHPNWWGNFNQCPIELLHLWQGYTGMEIYNGVIGNLDGSQYALDKWDMVLSSGRRIWGFANDDSHWDGDYGLGWNIPYVKERTAPAIVDALANGRFYASTGVMIENIAVEGNVIRIKTQNASRIVATIQNAKRIKVADASSIEVTVPDDAQYVRFECWGNGESFAWTQPFFAS